LEVKLSLFSNEIPHSISIKNTHHK
jgi:hypothetical protein